MPSYARAASSATLCLTLAAAAVTAGTMRDAVAAQPASASQSCSSLQTSRTLDRGDSGRAVAAVQCALRGHSNEFADLVVDGHFGPATETAVTTFQARKALRADGVVGPATYRALRSTPVPDGDRPSVADGPTLRRGDVGPDVEVAQQAFGVTADGIYGRRTERAVAAFQGRQGLLVDGVLGPVTRQSLAANGLDGY
jgi:peptidoglycan hydrolase-like protein with peptidoglycan-binding domain